MKKRTFQMVKEISKGLTLIELLVVIAIIGVISGFAIVNYVGVRSHARDAQRKSDLRQLQSAFELYRSDQNTYPPSLPNCGSTLTAGGATYMQKIPCDPTNSDDFQYNYTTTGTTYTLTACLENVEDMQKDTTNNDAYCSGGTTNWSYTLTNP